MKIAFISNNLPPIVDGVGDYTNHLANEFVRNGHKVSVICSAKPEIMSFARTGTTNFTVYPIVKQWNIRGIHSVYQQIEQLRPDWILLQYVPYAFQKLGVSFTLAIFVMLLKFKGIKVMTMVHEPFIRFNSNPKYFLIALLQRIIGFFVFSFSEFLITSISRYERQMKFFNTNVFRIQVGSNILPFSIIREDSEQLKHKYLNNKETLITTFGNRNPRILFESLDKLRGQGHAVKLLLLGKIKEDAYLILQNEYPHLLDHITATGYLDVHDLFLHLSIADLFILPQSIDHKNRGGVSLKSGSLAAAFAAGLPIISFKGDMTDILLEDEYNIVFAKPEPNSIAQHVIRIINDSALKEKLSNHAKDFYEHNLSWEAIYIKYMDIMKSVN